MKLKIFKTIKSRMIFMQLVVITVALGIVFILFSAFADEYYFVSKLDAMEEYVDMLENEDMENIANTTRAILLAEEQNIRFVISNEKFQAIYVTYSLQDKTSQQAKVANHIVKRLQKYSEGKTIKKNGKNRISVRKVIIQKNHKYYVYAYETKLSKNIKISYYIWFFGVVIVMVLILAIIISIIISNRLCRPIKQIERNTREAVNNNYKVNINENQEFLELSGLAHSINIMMSKIREQIESLENEIEHKTKVENLRRQFVNNVSHEMKTPLAIISNQVEMLELLKDEKKKKEYCRSIIEEAENMSQMINDMIVIYSIQADEDGLKVVNANINELVEFTCRDYDKLYELKNINIVEEYPKECYAYVNERFFSQAVSNYITNAIKHCRDNGTIHVRVVSQETFVRVEVENDGENIPESKKNCIWDMFYKGDNSGLADSQKGSGLGLYLVRSIIELHGGTYGFENLNQGVKFYINIPKVQKKD